MTTDPTTTTAIAQIVGFLSPLVVDAIKRDSWKPSQTLLLGAGVSVVIYVLLHIVLGTFTLPVTTQFIVELFSVFGLQQAGYALYFKERNRIVEVPTTTNVIADKVVVTDATAAESVPGK